MVDKEFKQILDKELEKFFQEKINSVSKFDPRLRLLIEQIQRVTLSGGKRLRPYFCQLGYQIGGGSNFNIILPVLLSLELTHTFALIHDDIIDKALTRHHVPTIHAYFTQNPRTDQIVDDLGQSLAILAGDLCLVWAEELMDKKRMSSWREPRILVRLIGSRSYQKKIRDSIARPTEQDSLQNDKFFQAKKLYHDMLEELAYGQILDTWGMRGKTSEEILHMYQMKSGCYSVEKPLLIGANLAGAQQDVINALSVYGQKIGLAFQIQDDLLGVFGKEKTTGKSVGTDIEEGKWTILISFTLEKLISNEKEVFLKILNKTSKTAKDIQQIKKAIVETGSQNEARELMVKLTEEAVQTVKLLNSDNRKKLEEIGEWIINRRK